MKRSYPGAMQITAIHHVSLVVSDTERALAFYCGVLGLPLNPHRPDLPFDGAWLDLGPQQLHLIEQRDAPTVTDGDRAVGRGAHLAMTVDDLEALIRALENAGVPYRRSQRRPALFCRDPDGNGLELIGR